MALKNRIFGNRKAGAEQCYINAMGSNVIHAARDPANRQFGRDDRFCSMTTLSSFGDLTIDGSLANIPMASCRPNQPLPSAHVSPPRPPPNPPTPPTPTYFGSNDFGDFSPFERKMSNNNYQNNNPYGKSAFDGPFNHKFQYPSTNNFNNYSKFGHQQPPLNSFSNPNLAPGNGYPPSFAMGPEPQQRKRRQKYIPPTRPDTELFNEQNHIQKGVFWEQMFGEKQDEKVSISCVEDGTQSKDLIQYFEQCHFSREIMNSIELRKFNAPTQIQKGVIPFIQKNKRDLMAHAPTGSGKSAAFLLPIISETQSIRARLPTRAPNRDSPYALIVTPTKELAEQLWKDARSFAINTGVSVQRTYGDMWVRESKQLLLAGCDICIVTCGRLLHFVREKLIRLNNLRYLVLDEADKLLSCEHFHACVDEVKKNPDINPEHRVLMFSATYGESVQGIAQQFLRHDYFFVHFGGLNLAVTSVRQEFIEVSKFNKQNKLLEILKAEATYKTLPCGDKYWKPAMKTMVFVEQKRQSDRVAIALSQEKFQTISLNSDRTLSQRSQAVFQFTTGALDVLVCTDVAARGLNFPGVDHVINYDLPEKMEDKETYVHRIGRTGRAGNTGLATSFFDPTSPDDTLKAGDYIKVLEGVGQPVPGFLRKFAAENAGYAPPQEPDDDGFQDWHGWADENNANNGNSNIHEHVNGSIPMMGRAAEQRRDSEDDLFSVGHDSAVWPSRRNF